MAKIIDGQRRIIRLSEDDVISVIREYQRLVYKSCCYEQTREILKKFPIFIPEEL